MRSPDPVVGVPNHNRGYDNASQDRYHTLIGKGDAGCYVTLPCTLEEEARNGGWLPGAHPTGPPPRQLFTLGMRGEPDFDDDPSPTTTNSYRQAGGGVSGDGD